MEEDIKILEEFLDLARTRDYKGNLTGSFLENLITRYKQLEEENKESIETYKSEKTMKNNYVQYYQDLLLKENCIPKSKVREKIEEAKKLANELNWSHFDMSEEASKEYIKAIETVLSELEKKDKIIDLMAEQLAGLAIFDIEKDEPLILGDKEEVKQYFKEKVEEDNLC